MEVILQVYFSNSILKAAILSFSYKISLRQVQVQSDSC